MSIHPFSARIPMPDGISHISCATNTVGLLMRLPGKEWTAMSIRHDSSYRLMKGTIKGFITMMQSMPVDQMEPGSIPCWIEMIVDTNVTGEEGRKNLNAAQEAYTKVKDLIESKFPAISLLDLRPTS